MKAHKETHSSPALHVEPHRDGWAVRRGDTARPSSVHRTQKEAVQSARNLARGQRSALLVHGRDGHVRSETSYAEYPQAVALAAGQEFLGRYRRAFERLAKL
jgi:hypothetical protein